MYCEKGCLGMSHHMDIIRNISDSLNAEVVEQINESQELIMLNNFSQESNEYRFKKVMQDRISEVSSWHWVLEDLAKRLDEATDSLKYEQNALHVVVNRIQDEIDNHSKEKSKPGVLSPLTDSVEEAIIQEYNCLCKQKKKFEKLIVELNKQMGFIEKTKKRINNDLLNKEKAITIDKACANKDYSDAAVENWKKNQKKGCPVNLWLRRSEFLKRAGLRALCNALISRHQVRQARIQLTIAAQGHASRVDAILKRRLHANQIKLEDLLWQRGEAVKDYQSLDEELLSTEKSLVEILDKMRIIEARIAERTHRPGRELTKDDVNRKLKDELTQMKKVIKDLRSNHDRIMSVQHKISKAITHIDRYGEDISQIIKLDDDRIQARLGTDKSKESIAVAKTSNESTPTDPTTNGQLTIILEEAEEDDDDYPFDN